MKLPIDFNITIQKHIFLHAGVCFHNGSCWSVNFRPGRKHNALSMEFCFLPVGRGKWKTAGRCHPEDSYVPTSRPFNISCDVIGGMRRWPITLSLGQLLSFSFFLAILRHSTQITYTNMYAAHRIRHKPLGRIPPMTSRLRWKNRPL